MIQKIVLYGSGRRCETLCKILQYSAIEIITILDSDPVKWGCIKDGHPIESPDKIHELHRENICITIADYEIVKEVREMLCNVYRYDTEKEIHYNQLVLEAYKQSTVVRQYFAKIGVKENKKESVIFDCYNGLVLGGVEAWTMDLCKALIEDRKKQTYILSDMGVYQVSTIIKNHIIYVDIDHQEQFSANSILNIIKAIMCKLPCKVVTCTTNEVMLAAYLIKKFYPSLIEIISVIHNSNEQVYEEYADFRECSDFYIGVSEDIRENMLRQGINPERIYSMTCPFECDAMLIRTYSEKSTQPIRIGYAGRIEHRQKRMDLLLEVAKVLSNTHINFDMEIAGDGTVRQEMDKFVDQNNLGRKVHFLGRLNRSELSHFWRRQDICLNLADYEGRSIGIIEAMGNGVVPIVTATSGVREDIVNDVNGYIVPVGDYYAMASRIEYLSRHRERLSDMGRRAHDAVYPKSLMEPHLKFWKEILFG